MSHPSIGGGRRRTSVLSFIFSFLKNELRTSCVDGEWVFVFLDDDGLALNEYCFLFPLFTTRYHDDLTRVQP